MTRRKRRRQKGKHHKRLRRWHRSSKIPLWRLAREIGAKG